MDLLVGLRGLEAEAFLRAIDVPFVGEVLRVVGREDFIAMKLFAGGPQGFSQLVDRCVQGGRARGRSGGERGLLHRQINTAPELRRI